MTTPEAALTLNSVTKIFGEGAAEITAVSNIDLTVGVGEILLIMGPSGSGKTTLLTMIAGLLRPTNGTIMMFGENVSALPEKKRASLRRRHIGFVFQSFNLLASLTAIQNVEVTLNVAGKQGKQATDRAREMLTRVGLGDRLHHLPDKLSGGERQRVSIARALANDPPLILADEPTASLDSQNGRQVVSLLHDLAKDEGRTVVIVSHDSRIQRVADRVIWLEDGKWGRRLHDGDFLIEPATLDD